MSDHNIQTTRTLPHHPRRVVHGFKVPLDHPPTRNELTWLECLRALTGDRDPPPTLPAVQTLRRVLTDK